MATICFRPPPLPPKKQIFQKKPSSTNFVKLSSTYLSFRDPSEDIEMKQFSNSNNTTRNLLNRKISHTNSLNRGKFNNNNNSRGFLYRCHSEGNLDKIVINNNNDDDGAELNNNHQLSISRYMRVLSGSWKNLLNLGGMSRPPKATIIAKKVAPPAVPHEFRHSGSSFGSAGYGSSEDGSGGFLTTSSINDPSGIPSRDDHSDYGSTLSGGSTGKSPNPMYAAPPFTFPVQHPGGVLTHKAAVYYHHQLSLQEDQGIDMTQSPGRDSPGSSSGSAGSGSRHSTASLDSGRASSYHPASAGGRSTICSSNSPRCSLSSCSIGSASASSSSSAAAAAAADQHQHHHHHHQSRIERMIQQGLPDQEIIHSLLVELQFEEYFPLFVSAGYDLPTIGRMTPEDLTAIGIKKPNHRKRLKAEIAQLNLPDNLPEFVPGSLEEWLNLLRLDEYLPAFIEQSYQTIDDVAQLTWEDLEEFGIVKLGHQKKIMLAIKRIKDLKAGKRIITNSSNNSSSSSSSSTDSGRIIYTTQDVLVHVPPMESPEEVPQIHGTFRSFHQPWELDQTRQIIMSSSIGPNSSSSSYSPAPIYCTDQIVPIKIRTGRGKSLESLEDPNERTHHTFSMENNQTFYYTNNNNNLSSSSSSSTNWRPRSYDDGDITPTNETSLLLQQQQQQQQQYEGGGTLPRPRGVIRPRQIAKISASSKQQIFPDFIVEKSSSSHHQYKTLPSTNNSVAYIQQFGTAHQQQQQQQGSPMLSKKIPPHPPKRRDSECSNDSCDTNNTTTVEIHHHHHHQHLHHHTTNNSNNNSSLLPLPAYPSSDSLSISLESGGDLPLPPPPAPGTPPGHQKLNSSQSWGAEEQELIKSLTLQHRNGSDASFKSSSSTESDSLPFANENAGTIRTRTGTGNFSSRPSGLPVGHPSPTAPSVSSSSSSSSSSAASCRQTVNANNNNNNSNNSSNSSRNNRSEPADVLNDIGNMLANLTDELDAMLEEEKRQQ